MGSDIINEIDSNKNSLFYGNVGIGVVNPTYKLDVNGDLQVNNHIYTPHATNTDQHLGWREFSTSNQEQGELKNKKLLRRFKQKCWYRQNQPAV